MAFDSPKAIKPAPPSKTVDITANIPDFRLESAMSYILLSLFYIYWFMMNLSVISTRLDHKISIDITLYLLTDNELI